MKINSDDPNYLPIVNKDGSCDLSVNFRVSPCIGRITTVVSNDKILLGHRMIALIDCGISLEIPEDYQFVGFIKREFSQKGLVLMTNKVVDENGRVKIIVCNIGHESIEIKHGDKIACIELVQNNKFKWKTS